MALDVKVGAFSTPTSTGNLAITGLGFQPKAVWLFVAGTTSDGTIMSHIQEGYGFICQPGGGALVSVAHACRVQRVESGVNTSTGRNMNTAKCLLLMHATTAATNIVVANPVSFDADGFTLNFTTVDASNQYKVMYLAIGGADIADVDGIAHDYKSTAGTRAITTGSGFKLANYLTCSAPDAGSGGTMYNTRLFSLSFLDVAGGLGSASVSSVNGVATIAAHGRQRSQLLDAVFNGGGQAPVIALSGTPTTTGWTENVQTPVDATNNPCFSRFQILGTLKAKVGAETVRTTTGSKSTTGLGFTPKALICFGRLVAASTSVTTHGNFFVSITDGTTTRSMSFCDQGIVSDGQSDQLTGTNLIQKIDENPINTKASTIVGALTSLDADGFTVNYSTVNGVAGQFYYVALGEGPTATSVAPGVAEAAASASAPAVTQISDDIVTAGIAIVVAQASAPTISTIVSQLPGVASCVALSINSGLIAGEASQTPGVASAIARGLAPGVVTSVAFEPTVALTAGIVVAPVIIAGEATQMPGLAISAVIANSPSLTTTVDAVPGTAAADALAFDAMADVSLSLAPDSAEAICSAVAPALVTGAVSAQPSTAISLASAVALTTAAGGVMMAPGVAHGNALALGTIASANVTLSPDPAIALVSAVAPAIFAIVSSSPGTAIASSSATSPAAVAGEVTISSLGVASALARAFDVIIVQQPLVTGPLLSSASQWFVCGSIAGRGFAPDSFGYQSNTPSSRATRSNSSSSEYRQAHVPGK